MVEMLNRAGKLRRAKIEFPILWSYKIIGEEDKKEDIEAFIYTVFANRSRYEISSYKRSSKSKYISITVAFEANSYAEIDRYFNLLKSSSLIKVVL